MSKSKKGFGRAGLSALATTTLVIGACAALAAPANATFVGGTGGSIGLVDTVNTTAPGTSGTQGATLVEPGKAKQAIGSIRLLVPNAAFAQNDTIQLALLDRSASPLTGDPGTANTNAATVLGFDSVPTVTVNPNPLKYTAAVAANPGNPNANPPVPPTPAQPASPQIGPKDSQGTEAPGFPAPSDIDTGAGHATTPPSFDVSLTSSSRAQGHATDLLQLRLNNKAGGNPTDLYEVTITGLTVNVGANVTPGELRVVPFAYDGTNTNSSVSAVPTAFQGNKPDDSTTPVYDPTIGVYTVPAYVDPITFAAGSPSTIVADSTTQKVGDLSLAETNTFSLQPGVYTVNIGGASNSVIKNGNTGDKITASIADGATGAAAETVTVSQPAANATSFTFTVTAGTADPNTSLATVKISGLELATPQIGGQAGSLTYTLSGGSVSDFLATAGTSPAIGTQGQNPPEGVAADTTQLGNTVNQTDIVAPKLVQTAQATSVNNRIGGADRYSTAAKIAITGGPVNSIVLASGENFPDALSANYLAGNFITGTLLTRTNSIPAVTLDAIRTLGVNRVFIVGGPNAVSKSVQTQLENTRIYDNSNSEAGQSKLQVTRLGGDDRYATSRVISEYAAATGLQSQTVGSTNFDFGTAAKRTAIVATGLDFPDALSAGAPSATGQFPLVLTKSTSLSPDAARTLQNLGIEEVVIAGGTDAVSTAVETAITNLGIQVKRVAGDTRYGTAAAMADLDILPANATATTSGGFGFDDPINTQDDEEAILATGEKYADALAGGPYAGAAGDPVLLTRTATLSPETQKWLTDHASTYNAVQALGLTAAVSEPTLTSANQAVSK